MGYLAEIYIFHPLLVGVGTSILACFRKLVEVVLVSFIFIIKKNYYHLFYKKINKI